MTKSVTYNFHVYDSQGNHKYDMILGSHILSELKIDSCLFNNTIRVNSGAYEGCTSPIKYISKINFNSSFDWLKDKNFWNEALK